ncbi:MAG: glycosyltransferase family 4 protein [Deltaproteobacteria bacterium]|nr:glycosyltransferase family 4 protein [Deltaproteobacteria bacterium]
MRVAFLTPEFVTEPNYAGGLANYLFRTCLALKHLGHNPSIFVRGEEDRTFFFRGIKIYRIRIETPAIIKITDRLTCKRLSQPLSFISTAWAFSKKLKDEHKKMPFDIVQGTNYQSISLLIGRDIPKVVRISSFEPLWRKAYKKPLTMGQKMIERMEILALKRADGTFAPSRMLARQVENALHVNVKVIQPPFMVETVNFDTSIYEHSLKDKKYLLFFGTIGLMKGCKSIAEIIETILLRNKNLFFVFVGKSVEHDGQSMIDHIKEKAGAACDRVIYSGPLKHESLYPIIENARAVILPSIIDNFPNTCLEAMSFGQIVVGTEGTSFEEIIEDGKSGFLCLPNNPKSLLEKASRALGLMEKERNSISLNAKKRVSDLEPERAVQRLVEYYESIIEARKEKIDGRP